MNQRSDDPLADPNCPDVTATVTIAETLVTAKPHTTDVSDTLFPRPGAVVAQYELIRHLGSGSMGAVYLARDLRLGRRVAIKFLARKNDFLAKRFQAEARATARCQHDNIVDIHDVGEANGHSYMVLEYLKGITLSMWLAQRRRPLSTVHKQKTDARFASEVDIDTDIDTNVMDANAPVSPSLAIELMIPVLQALAHAHEFGLVHRDLKPANIMLTDNGSIKVLDFGIAKVLDRPTIEHQTQAEFIRVWTKRGFETRADALVGTMPYMSPEQCGAGDIDQRTDIWAVGILFWLILTGRHPLAPFTKRTLGIVTQIDVPMPSISDQRPDLGPLGDVVDLCLAKNKTNRIRSAQALLDLLVPLLSSHSSPPPESEPDNPFVGLAAFQPTDGRRFFGRDRDIASLMAMIRNYRMVTVAGASGAGKSSFIRAGVIPALKRSGQMWESFIIRPGRLPLVALANVLDQVSRALYDTSQEVPEVGSQDTIVDNLRSRPGYLGAVLRTRCANAMVASCSSSTSSRSSTRSAPTKKPARHSCAAWKAPPTTRPRPCA